MTLSKAEQYRRRETREALRALTDAGLKGCTGCGEVKPFEDFYTKVSAGRRIPRSKCKPCYDIGVRSWKARNQERNRDSINARARDKRKADPLSHRLAFGAYRARRLGCEVEQFDSIDLELFWLCNGINPDVCVYCGAQFEHLDHTVPLSRGGHHSVDNIVPSCRSCNDSKADKLPHEWRAAA